MTIIKEITDKCFELNSIAAKITIKTTIGELNYIRSKLDSIRVMARGFRMDLTPVDMVEMTLSSKLHDAMYHSPLFLPAEEEHCIPVVRMRNKGYPPLVFKPSDIKWRMTE